MDFHRAAEAEMAAGLSPWARWTIALAAGGSGVLLAAIAPTLPRPWVTSLVALALGLIAVATVAPATVARACGRVVGAGLFAAGCWALYSGFIAEHPPDDPHTALRMVEAVGIMIALGIPGAYYAIRGRFRDAEIAAREIPDDALDHEPDPEFH